LGREGFTVSTAATAAETLRRLGEQAVDLVVLDIGLQQEDGLQVLASIKADHPQVQVIMLTGMGFVEDLLQEAQRHGADGYVSKVLPLNELLLAITRVMKDAPAAEPR
jgi:DNA-binding response OmpR family regulator